MSLSARFLFGSGPAVVWEVWREIPWSCISWQLSLDWRITVMAALILSVGGRQSLRSLSLNSRFFYRNMSSSYLVDSSDSKYAFLKDLGLQTVNDGVFNGKWGGRGEVSFYHFIISSL